MKMHIIILCSHIILATSFMIPFFWIYHSINFPTLYSNFTTLIYGGVLLGPTLTTGADPNRPLATVKLVISDGSLASGFLEW